MTTRASVVYVVDYDIPSKWPAHRRRFYRKLRKIFKEHGVKWDRSTMSVLITPDYNLACAVHGLAAAYGKASLYEGVQISESQV